MRHRIYRRISEAIAGGIHLGNWISSLVSMLGWVRPQGQQATSLLSHKSLAGQHQWRHLLVQMSQSGTLSTQISVKWMSTPEPAVQQKHLSDQMEVSDGEWSKIFLKLYQPWWLTLHWLWRERSMTCSNVDTSQTYPTVPGLCHPSDCNTWSS